MESGNSPKLSAASVLLMCAVFVASAVVGYVSTSLVAGNGGDGKYDPLTVEVIQPAYMESDNSYGLVLGSNWTGNSSVRFELYQPQDTVNAVSSSNNGQFSGIPGIVGGSYCVRAYVNGESYKSKLYVVNGFPLVEHQADRNANPLENIECRISDVKATQENVYSFNVSANVSSDLIDKVEYDLFKTVRGKDTLQTEYASKDGGFSKVKVEEGCHYFVRLEVTQNDRQYVSEMFPVDKIVWRMPQPAMARLTESEVQNLINERKSLLNDKHFAKPTRIVISNPNETSSNWKTLDNFMQQKFAWSSVTVEGLTFTKNNQVETVSMSVNY